MRRGWIWGGFGALLLVGVLSGYAPDVMLAQARSGARAEGLLTTTPPVPAQEDARLAYQQAARTYNDGWNLLGNDFARQVKSPRPHVVKYLEAMAEASKRPLCSTITDGWNGTYYGRPEADVVSKAALALTARAKDADDLAAAARIAHHLGTQSGPLCVGHWAVLVPKVLDRAKALGLPPEPFVAALGSPVAPREAMRRHVSAQLESMERATAKEGSSMSRTRQEVAYLRFWRGFFTQHPSDAGFTEALRRSNMDIDVAENRNGAYLDLGPVVGAPTDRWAAWATLVEKADQRLAAGR